MLLAALAAFTGAAVQSASGFGFALVLGPALFAVLAPSEAVIALLVLGLLLNLLVIADGPRPAGLPWRRLGPMLLAAAPGLAAGAALLAIASKEALQVAVGACVLLAAGVQLRRPVPAAGGSASRRAACGVGFVSGALTTSTSVSGPPIVLWLEAQGLGPRELRAALAWSFLALNAAGWLVVLAAGEDGPGIGVLVPLALLVLAGHAAGALVFRRLDAGRFRGLVLGLVIAAGAASVAAGLLALV